MVERERSSRRDWTGSFIADRRRRLVLNGHFDPYFDSVLQFKGLNSEADMVIRSSAELDISQTDAHKGRIGMGDKY